MKISLDFGGSTTDMVYWDGKKIKNIRSFEFNEIGVVESLDSFFKKTEVGYGDVSEIYVTGGRSRNFSSRFNGLDVVKVNEIDAIGKGGRFLAPSLRNDFLVVSMGTGTCMVKVSGSKYEHIGGTGVGGGTFLALTREMLKESDVEKVKEMFNRGDLSKIDISVGDIIGGDIGMIKSDTTASNLGKLARGSNFMKEDLACGIVNLVGQVIASCAVFGAKAHCCRKIILGGKLTEIKQITDVICKVADLYGLSIEIPKDAKYISAIGAGA